MKKEPKRFITKFRKSHDLYGKYVTTRDVKKFLISAAWMSLDSIDIHLSDEDIWSIYGTEIFAEGKFRYSGKYLIDLSPLLDEIDVEKGRIIYL